MTFVYIFFSWLMLMIIWNVYKNRQENKSNKGGQPMKHFNGRFYW